LHALTLWFVVMIFLQTASGTGGPLLTAVGVFSLVLLWAIPLFLLWQLWTTVLTP